MINDVWTKGKEMKHEQCSVDWRKWDETRKVKCRLKETTWSMNNEVDDVILKTVKLSQIIW